MGELTLRVRSIVLLAKSLQPFPVPKEKIQDGKIILLTNFATENDIFSLNQKISTFS